MEGIRHYGNPTKLYLLHSKNDENFKFENLAKLVKKKIESNWCKTELVLIDAFNAEDVLRKILKIIAKYKKSNAEILINVTGGTNLMASIASTASFIGGVRAYYVLDPNKTNSKKLVFELPIPIMPKTNTLRKRQSEILGRINQYKIINNKKIETELGLRPQEVNYHLTELEKKNLIKVSRGWEYQKGEKIKIDKRQITIEITKSGEFISDFPALI
jgi:DNA-binding MarR family transcriptional regulator